MPPELRKRKAPVLPAAAAAPAKKKSMPSVKEKAADSKKKANGKADVPAEIAVAPKKGAKKAAAPKKGAKKTATPVDSDAGDSAAEEKSTGDAETSDHGKAASKAEDKTEELKEEGSGNGKGEEGKEAPAEAETKDSVAEDGADDKEAQADDDAPAKENKGDDAAKAKEGPPEVGDVVELSGFGGEIETNDGKSTTLEALVDESKAGVVLFTYPKASTPGCTKQACLFRDSYEPLTATGLSIYGLSGDNAKANTAFKDKNKLPYPLLCDTKFTLLAAIGLKKGAKGAHRGVFVVDKSGKVIASEAGGPDATLHVVEKLVEQGDEDGIEEVSATMEQTEEKSNEEESKD